MSLSLSLKCVELFCVYIHLTFTKFGKYLAIISSNILPDSFSLFFFDSHVYAVVHDCCPQGPLGSVIFFILFFFCFSGSTVLLSYLQFSDSFFYLLNMLLNFSRVFVSVIVLSDPEFLFGSFL